MGTSITTATLRVAFGSLGPAHRDTITLGAAVTHHQRLLR